MPKFHIGTAGWSYKDWVPAFYPRSQSGGFDWLEYYAHYFNCVEVNSSYYTYISPKIVKGWIEKISDSGDFLFTVKLHQDFTHRMDYDEQKIKSVVYNLEMLYKAEKLGGLLIQFPYSFSYNEAAVDYVRELRARKNPLGEELDMLVSIARDNGPDVFLGNLLLFDENGGFGLIDRG